MAMKPNARSALKRKTLTQEHVKTLYRYDPIKGRWTYAKDRLRCKVGEEACRKSQHNYRRVIVDRVAYPAHRLAWFYMTGDWPDADVDHIDGNRENNSWANLRKASRSQNISNSKKKKSALSTLKGAHFDSERRLWVAQITKNYKNIHLGRFETEQEAHEAYVKAAQRLNGEFARAA